MGAPKTQRAWAAYGGHDQLDELSVTPCRTMPWSIDTPVLVVPEDAVSKCKHEDANCYGLVMDSGPSLLVCRACGATQWNNKRWQRPKILRVGRSK